VGVDIYDFKKLGCDVEELLKHTRTPTSLKFEQTDELREIDKCLIDCARGWGRPFGYWQEQDGAIVQNIFPIKKSENEQISSSSKKPLEMHTETAFHPWLPQYVFLLCLRGDSKAGTTFVDIDELVANLTKDEINILHQPIFKTSIDASFLNSQQTNKTITMPILYNNGSSIRYDRNLMHSDDIDGHNVLLRLAELVEELKVVIYLETGQMAVIENWKIIHGRTEFMPRYDGWDRWLKRILVRRSMPFGYDVDINDQGNFYIVNMVL
jgi:L-asparagine oxygenase